MWNFRKLGQLTFLRKGVHSFFNRIYSTGRVITISRGPLKGMKWYCHSQHQFWMPLGIYEKETTNWLLENMTPETVFYDIGANAGYFVLLGGKYAAQTFGFEPVPSNVQVINQHIAENKLKNVVLNDVAMSDSLGKVSFTHEENNANSHMTNVETPHAKNNQKNVFEVDTITLDEFTKNNPIPSLIKIDVEGAEVMVLKGAEKTLSENKIKLIVSTHSKELEDECKKMLKSYGYELSNLEGFEHEILAEKKI